MVQETRRPVEQVGDEKRTQAARAVRKRGSRLCPFSRPCSVDRLYFGRKVTGT
jgi:hypothetical protein